MDESKASPPTKTPEYVPTSGLLRHQETDGLILCKPKLMPLKSVTLEKLEKMQSEAERKLKEQQDIED